VMAHLGAWGRRHLPVTRELAVRAELLERGGPELWEQFMDELRAEHLGIPRLHTTSSPSFTPTAWLTRWTTCPPSRRCSACSAT
jgi:hypothetical protein